MQKKPKQLIYWLPRILSILLILFLFMFSFDVFEASRSIGEMAIGFLIHNIPVIVLTTLLVIAWKHEIVGAVAFLAGGILYIAMNLINGTPWYLTLSWSATISGPAFLISALFFVGWRQKHML